MIRVVVVIWLFCVAVSPVAAGSGEILNGAGASFPSPLYDKLIAEYQQRHDVYPDGLSVENPSGLEEADRPNDRKTLFLR